MVTFSRAAWNASQSVFVRAVFVDEHSDSGESAPALRATTLAFGHGQSLVAAGGTASVLRAVRLLGATGIDSSDSLTGLLVDWRAHVRSKPHDVELMGTGFDEEMPRFFMAAMAADMQRYRSTKLIGASLTSLNATTGYVWRLAESSPTGGLVEIQLPTPPPLSYSIMPNVSDLSIVLVWDSWIEIPARLLAEDRLSLAPWPIFRAFGDTELDSASRASGELVELYVPVLVVSLARNRTEMRPDLFMYYSNSECSDKELIPLLLDSTGRAQRATSNASDAASTMDAAPRELCESCPDGSVCPGGRRLWPRPNYWSASERERPTRCETPSVCLGSIDSSSQMPSSVRNADGSMQTDRCSSGYTGAYCAVCPVGFYSDFGVCRPCGQSADDRREFIILVSVAIAAFVALAFAVARLPTPKLIKFVSALIALQSLIMVAKVGIRYSLKGSRTSTAMIRYLGILLFEIEFVKPGCTVPRLSFLSVYLATILLVLLAGLLFVAAAFLRALLQELCSPRSRRARAVAPQPELAPPAAFRRTGNATKRLESEAESSSSVVGEAHESAVRGNLVPVDRECAGAGDGAELEVNRVDVLDADCCAAGELGVTHAVVHDAHARATLARHAALEADQLEFDAASDRGVVALYEAMLDESDSSDLSSATSSSSSKTSERNESFCRRVVRQARARAVHSVLILGSIAYIQLSVRTLQALFCERTADGRLLLRADMQTVCYKGRHLVAAPFLWTFTIVFLGGFPIMSFFIGMREFLWRSSRSKAGVSVELFERARKLAVIEQYGFLFSGVRPRFWFVRPMQYITRLVFAIEVVTLRDPPVKLFSAGLNFTLSYVITATFFPFEQRIQNVLSIAAGLGAWAQVLYFLSTFPSRYWFWLAIIVQCVLSAMVIFFHIWQHRVFLWHLATRTAAFVARAAYLLFVAPFVWCRTICRRVRARANDRRAAANDAARRAHAETYDGTDGADSAAVAQATDAAKAAAQAAAQTAAQDAETNLGALDVTRNGAPAAAGSASASLCQPDDGVIVPRDDERAAFHAVAGSAAPGAPPSPPPVMLWGNDTDVHACRATLIIDQMPSQEHFEQTLAKVLPHAADPSTADETANYIVAACYMPAQQAGQLAYREASHALADRRALDKHGMRVNCVVSVEHAGKQLAIDPRASDSLAQAVHAVTYSAKLPPVTALKALKQLSAMGILSLNDLAGVWTRHDLQGIGVGADVCRALEASGMLARPRTLTPQQLARMSPAQQAAFREEQEVRRRKLVLGARRFKLQAENSRMRGSGARSQSSPSALGASGGHAADLQ